MNTYLTDLMSFFKKELKEGKTDFRLRVSSCVETGEVSDLRAYIHPLDKSGETFDFCLAKVGEDIQIMSNPNVTKSDCMPGTPDQVEPLLQFFSYQHLPDHLQKISAPFGLLALDIVSLLPRNPERTVALRKLLEAKDCAVRALIYK